MLSQASLGEVEGGKQLPAALIAPHCLKPPLRRPTIIADGRGLIVVGSGHDRDCIRGVRTFGPGTHALFARRRTFRYVTSRLCGSVVSRGKMPDVFISYSRRDSEFVDRLAAGLTEHQRDVWIDVRGIEDGQVFPDAIRTAIEGADSFVYVITPESAHSRHCAQEVDYAQQLSKRIIPILRRPVADDELLSEIRYRNWIPFQDDGRFEEAIARLLTACDRDLAHVKSHTRWLTKGLEWEAESRDDSFLLRGRELTAAEDWLAASGPGTDPQPTELQREYVLLSRRAATRRGRHAVIVAGTVAVLAVILVVFALISRQQAVSARQSATAQALAQAADANLLTDPQISLTLGVRAVREDPLPQSLYALRGALDASPLLGQYDAPAQCATTAGQNRPGAAYRPVGDQVAVALCDGSVIARDGRTGAVQQRRQVAASGDGSISYSPDGSLLAIGAQNAVVVLRAATLAEVARFSVHGIATVQFARPGSRCSSM
jgi:hypothetical protein